MYIDGILRLPYHSLDRLPFPSRTHASFEGEDSEEAKKENEGIDEA